MKLTDYYRYLNSQTITKLTNIKSLKSIERGVMPWTEDIKKKKETTGNN